MQIKLFSLLISSSLALFCLLVPKLILAQSDSVTITEVMFDPAGNEGTDEFIELYNFSSLQTYDLTNWLVSDSAGGNDSDKIVNAGEGMLLYPGQYAIIIDSTNYNPLTYTFHPLIPDTARIFFINNSTFGSGGLSNSTTETVMLIKPSFGQRDTVSRYKYSLGNAQGHSDEKLSLNNDNSASNWTNSLYLNGTPGNHTELILSINDYPIIFSPIQPLTGDSLLISAIVKNDGIMSVNSFQVKLYEDTSRNLSADPEEVIDSVDYSLPLSRNDSAVINFRISSISSGTHRYIAKLIGNSILPYSDSTVTNKILIDSVETLPAMDLTINSFTLSPTRPRPNDTIYASIDVKNLGLTDATDFTLNFFKDLNTNRLPDANEVIDSLTYSGSLLVGDSTDFFISTIAQDTGQNVYIVQLAGSSVLPLPDEVSSNNRSLDSIQVIPPQDSIAFSEIMYDPIGSESSDEFIELYNYGTHSVNLQNWTIGDSLGSDPIIDAGLGTILNPGQYAAIFDSNYNTSSGAYHSIIPPEALVLKINGASFLSSGLVANYNKKIFLVRADNDTTATYRYSVDNIEGHSDEKIVLNQPNISTNWTNSLLLNGTPGAHAETDLSITKTKLVFAPSAPPTSSTLQISAAVFNAGIFPISEFTVKFYEDTNANLIAESGEIIDSITYHSLLARNDSTLIDITIPSVTSGLHRYIAIISGDSVKPYPDTTRINNFAMDSVETVPAYDVTVQDISFSPMVPSVGDSVAISAVIKNTGLNTVHSFKVVFFRDLNLDRLAESGEELDSTVFNGSLAPGDSVLLSKTDVVTIRGIHGYLVHAIPASLLPFPDEKPLNNIASGSVAVSPARYSIIINEINYDSAHGSTEWIELYNRSQDTLDIKKWRISDGNSDLLNFNSAFKTITTSSYQMLPGAFIIVGKDSNLFHLKYGYPAAKQFFISFPNLNNTGDMIGIFDSLGTVIDSLLYSASFIGPTRYYNGGHTQHWFKKCKPVFFGENIL